MKIFLYIDKSILNKYSDENGNFDSKNHYFLVDFDPKLSLYRMGFLERIVGKNPVLVIAETESEFYLSETGYSFYVNRFHNITQFKNPLKAIPILEQILSCPLSDNYNKESYLNKKISSYYFELVLDSFEMVDSKEISRELFDSMKLTEKPFSPEVIWSHTEKNWSEKLFLKILNTYGYGSDNVMNYSDDKRTFFIAKQSDFISIRTAILRYFLENKRYECMQHFLQYLKNKNCNEFISDWVKENYDKLSKMPTDDTERKELLKLLQWCNISVSGFILKEAGKKQKIYFKTKGELATYLIKKGHTDFDNATQFVDNLIKYKCWSKFVYGRGDDEEENDLKLSYFLE